MASDFYKVKVLHFINPHLIWVEISNPESSSRNDFVFEQIGIYGVLPLETTIDITEDSIKTQRCENWVPASYLLMKRALDEAAEIFFYPVYIDRRTSIFDDNIHKYGELAIIKHNGKQKKLSKLLIKDNYALYDECQFHQELCLGNLKTKLDNNRTHQVITQIELYYSCEQHTKKCVKKQTKVFNTGQKLEAALTEKNLKEHNKNSADCRSFKNLPYKDVQQLLQEKLNDLQMCKDIDEESAGRANKKITPVKEYNSSHLTKRLTVLKSNKTSQPPIEPVQDIRVILEATKQFLDANSNKKVFLGVKKEDNISDQTDGLDIPQMSNGTQGENGDGLPQKHEKKKAKKKGNYKIPQYDKETEKLIAYGPPDIDIMTLAPKIVARISTELHDDTTQDVNVKDEKPCKEDIYGDIDSDIDCDVSYQNNSKGTVDTSKEDVESHEPEEISGKLVLSPSTPKVITSSSLLKKRLQLHKECIMKRQDISSSVSDTSNKDSSTSVEDVLPKKRQVKIQKQTDLDSDDDSVSVVLDRIKSEYPAAVVSEKNDVITPNEMAFKNHHVNPFKNIDPKLSVFVDKLVTPILMVHTKKNNCIRPSFALRDANFNSHIYSGLINMSIEHPMMLQTVSWYTVLHGFSTFIISPKGSGKTMGYLPAVCRLISDSNSEIYSTGPIGIIICSTAIAVSEIERLSKIFLGNKEKVLACYAGMNEMDLTTSLLNGCDLLICTPSILVRLLQTTDFGVDLRRLAMFVLDDCERLSEIYANEIKFFFIKIKEMLKSRVVKELKIQYVLASRVWCEFMETLAKKAPDTVICIGAFQECVLYSKAHTTATFVTKDKKINSVLDFLKQVDTTKKTVVVCRSNEEVDILEKALTKAKFIVYACNNNMTVQDLYNLSLSWNEYEEPLSGPILVCCDGNLTHMNITDAHHLLHFSLPHLFSMFCKRFAVLNDNYDSIFKAEKGNVKIKILLEDDNVEQLPKILWFIKRCTDEVPKVLETVCKRVLAERDILKAKKLVPVCDNLLTLGECPDFWNCQERHAILAEYDKPKTWVPASGIIAFRILHYHNAVFYSARLLSSTVNGATTKYPQTYNMLAMKISTYFAKESNRKLHGEPKIGDICAVAIKQNFFVRSQVVKVLSKYQKGNPNYVLIRLIDEERLEKTRDIYLYHLPDVMKETETYAVHVRLANIQPKDKDITFSALAKDKLRKITEGDEDLYLRGQITLIIGNCILVDKLEACRDLSSVNKTVVRHDFKQELEAHAIANPEHMSKLEKLCIEGQLITKRDIGIEIPKPLTVLPEGRWAHLEQDELSPMFFTSADDPSLFSICLTKFEDCMNLLIKDIQKYVNETNVLVDFAKGDLILSKFPDDGIYERARIDDVMENKVKCFFVDKGDWRDVSMEYLYPITEKFLSQIPFQTIECRLVGVKPAGEEWTEFAINWFINRFEDEHGNLKELYVKYFTKEKAKYTGGYRYGVAVIDTNKDQDILINHLIIDCNLAQEDENEIDLLKEFDSHTRAASSNASTDEDDWEKVSRQSISNEITKNDNDASPNVPLRKLFMEKPIRSVPLVNSDYESDDDDKWQINVADDLLNFVRPVFQKMRNAPAIGPNVSQNTCTIKEVNHVPSKTEISDTDNSTRDIQIIQSRQKLVKALDSDDLTSPDVTVVCDRSCEIKPLITELEQFRKPRTCWRQNKSSVTIKIQLIGVEKYDMKIADKSIKFFANHDDTSYGFDFELYGVIDSKSSKHSNKGQYILVTLKKIRKTKWLTLAKEGNMKWIVWDVDCIDDSDDNTEVEVTPPVIRRMQASDSESEDEDFMDDLNYRYNR